MNPRIQVALMVIAASQVVRAQPTPVMPSGLQQVVKEIDATAERTVKNSGSISFALAAVTRDGVAWTKSYGFADVTKGLPATRDTQYRIGSAAFTGLMLLQLIHDGKVHLSDRVDKYFPEIKQIPLAYPNASPITLIQLATHTTGLELEPKDDAHHAGGPSDWETALAAALPYGVYVREPGTHVLQSGINEAILAAALRRAAGQSYADYIRQKILSPLGMTHTDFEPASEFQITLHTTIDDLAKFEQLVMLGGPDTVLPKSALEENYRRMWIVNSMSVPNPTEGVGIGYDGETWTSNGNSHYYFIPPIAANSRGYRSSMWFEPRTHAGIILLEHGQSQALNSMIHSYVYTLNAVKVDAGRQEPTRPYPYREEEVSFESRTGDVLLSGTLTIPSGTGPFPAVVLVSPSGPFTRDEPMLNHRPFLVLSDHLTRQGVAVLRYDIRGSGASGGKFATASRNDFADDVRAAVEFLKRRPEVAAQKVGLIGHVDGRRTASIAARGNSDVKFLVLLATPAVPVGEMAAVRNRLNAEASGESYAAAKKKAVRDSKAIALLKEESDAVVLEQKLRELLAGSVTDQQVQAQIKQLLSPAFRRSLVDDPAVDLGGVSCPVLALFGEKDLNTPAELNVPAMKRILAAAGNKNSEVLDLADLNSLLQTADTGLGREAFWAEETISPVALNKIAKWITTR
ncbi:MAG TPA: serine hydrolase [Bryobacteraceae bacterium]|nr:serine hydrolase [Bryobacteraceae bacterium]